MDVLTIISIGTLSMALICTGIVFLKLKIELEKSKIENERYKLSLILHCLDVITKYKESEKHEK